MWCAWANRIIGVAMITHRVAGSVGVRGALRGSNRAKLMSRSDTKSLVVEPSPNAWPNVEGTAAKIALHEPQQEILFELLVLALRVTPLN